MVAYLTKSDASEGFTQVIDFLNRSYIKYALTVNPDIYVSCIKQFWNTVAIKQVNDVTRLQALVDKKKVVITEAAISEVLRLDDAEGVDCLPNEEIFVELARMGYEKPSTKLTFYKAFFSSQWKFLIHIILQSLSAKRTSWNEFSSSMASAVICLSTGRKFIFSKYIFDSLVRNVDSTSKFYMYPRFIQLLIKNQIGDLSTHTTKYTSPALTQKVFANMRRVGKGFSGVETPLFEGMLVEQVTKEGRDKEEHVQDVADSDVAQGDDTAIPRDDAPEPTIPSPTPPTPSPQLPQDLPSKSQYDKVAQALEITKLKRRVKKLEKGNMVKVLKLQRLKKVGTSQRIDTSKDTVMDDASNQERIIDEMDKDDVVALMDDKEEDKKEEEAKVVEDNQVHGRQIESQAEIYKIDLDHASKVLSMQEVEPVKVHAVVDVVTTANLITEVVTAANTTISTVEPKVTAATTTAAPVRVVAASTRRRKGVVIRDPEEESTTSSIIPADTKSKDKGKGIMVEEPKPLKKKQHVEMDEEYARKLHAANVAGFRLDYFKGMSYDDIRLIFEAKFNSNIEFLLKTKEQMEEEENKAIQSIIETPAQKVTKRRKLNEEVEDLKRHLEIVPDEDDDVYTEATPLSRKVPVVDYEIINLNNKPYYKIIQADGTHQLYISFLTLLKNFDREDLEALWNLVKERFSTSKPKNFSDDFLLNTIGAMFEKPDEQAQVWKNQRSIHGQVKVKSWKILESYGVHIITFSTTQLILLVERRYTLSRFTLDQMLNAIRLQVKEESEMSLELLRLGHVNFKTINKLVKGNLVRGLPSKVFTNDNSCVACKKGKQHRASFTPSLSTEEPDNSLSIGDEHLDTIPAMESDEFKKFSVENLIPIPSESEGIPDNMCDVHLHDNSLPLDVLKDQFKDFSDSNDEFSSTDDDSFSIDNIEYVEASPPDSKLASSEVMEIVIPKSSSTSLKTFLEETNTFDNSLPEFETFCLDLEEISSGSTTTRSDISLPEYEAFYDDHVKEISSSSTTTHSNSSLYDSFIFDLSINLFPPADRNDFYEFVDELIRIISPPEYDYFFFKIEPNSGDFTMDVVEDISPTRERRVHNALPTHSTLQLNMEFKLSSESLFTYVVWIFIPFLLYLVAP
nr:hypothetical protein [Tanacetum cinerariifolium]